MGAGEGVGLSRRRFLAGIGAGTTAAMGVGSSRAVAQSSSGADWPMHRGDVGNTGTSSGVIPTDSIRERWQFDGGNALTAATVVDGTVYVGSGENRLYALDAATGESRWQITLADSIQSVPAVADGTVYFGADDASVHALSTDGNRQWRTRLGLPVRASPTPVGDTVYVGGIDGNVYAFDAATGDERWSFSTHTGIYGSPAVVDGVVYVANDDGTVFAIDAEEGQQYWQSQLAQNIRTPPVVHAGTVYAASDEDRVFALSAASGAQQWSSDIPIRSPASLAATDNVLAVPGSDGTLYMLDPGTGAARYEYSPGFECHSPIVAGGVLCLATDGSVVAIDPETSMEQWSHRISPGSQPALSVANGVVYAAAEDGTLYAIVGDETPSPGADPTATPTATSTPTPTPTATQTPDDGGSPPPSTPDATPTPAPDTDTTPAVVTDSPSNSFPFGENPMLLAGVGGAVVGSLLLAGYLRSRGRAEDGASVDSRGADTESAAGTGTEAADPSPDAELDELVEKATRALEEGRRARDANEYGRAATQLEDAVNAFDRALSAVDDEERAAGIRDDLEAAEAALLSVDSARQALDDVEELLASAEADMENAITAFVHDQRTVARVRFRQARDRYDRAVEQLDEAGIEAVDLSIEVSTDEALDEVDSFDAVPGVDEATVDTLREAGYDTPTDLGEMSVEELAATADVDDETAARLKVASWHTPGARREFASVDDVADRLEAATLGYRSC